jgi:hypothetical protein
MGFLSLAAGLLASCAVKRPVLGGAIAWPWTGGRGESLEVRLWRAGRDIPPGLSAARVAELEAERLRAMERLQRGPGRSDEARLRACLAEAGTPPELWCAAARVAAALGRYDLAPLLTSALEPSADARKTVGARAALHALYGCWFQGSAEVTPYLTAVTGGAGTRLLLETSRAEQARSRERLLSELVHRPMSAAAWLADPDPEVRSGAARVLALVFAREGEDQGRALEALTTHLEREHEPRAFHEGLVACIAPLERLGVEDPSSSRLRALLIDVARTEGDPRMLSAAMALARISWRSHGPRDLGHVLSGIEAMGVMLRMLAAADRHRGANDPDPLVGVLSALRQLCAQASERGLTAELRASSARASLFGVLGEPHQEEAVRAAAAAALPWLARLDDAPRLAAVLSDPSVGAQVKHALLGALGAILPELEREAEGAEELLAAVAAQTGAADADLRRRALALCAEPRLEPLVRGLDPGFLIERLGREDVREATLEILRLLQRFAPPGSLDALLALPRFERLCADPVTLDALAAVLQRLAPGSGGGAMRAALRLADVPAEETNLARLRHALALAAGLEESAASALDPLAHEAIGCWAWRVVRAGVAPRDLALPGLAFEQRLLEVHLPRGDAAAVVSGEGLDRFERAHLTALLRADLYLGAAGGTRGSKPQVEAAFESAQGLAATPELRWLVLRDRARFRAAANECVKALSDYRRLIEAGDPADRLLGIPDLRSAVDLLHRLGEAGGEERSIAGEACELLRRLVARPAWRAEPASVRMQDLRDWVRTALESRALPSLRLVESALADLPLTQVETQLEREPAPLWSGLTREAGWFQELLDLRVRVRLGLREIHAQG